MLEMLLLPVIVAICLLKELVIRNSDMLCTLNLGILVTIMIDDMAAAMHHLTKLECLLCKGAGTVVLARDCVGDTENVEAEGLRGRFGKWI